MNTAQVLSSDCNGLVAATGTIPSNSSNGVNSNKEYNNIIGTKPPQPVSRVVTKESLRLTEAVSSSSLSSGNDSSSGVSEPFEDEYDFHSPLFEFSLLEPDNKEAELLSLPLTAIELPLTPPPLEDYFPNTFDSCAATLLTPSASESDCSSSSFLLSTAAAIAATQPSQRKVSVDDALPSNIQSIAPPPLVSAAAPLPVISPKPKRARSNSKSSKTPKKASKKQLHKLGKPKAPPAFPTIPTATAPILRSTAPVISKRAMNNQQQPLQPQAAAPAPRPAAAPRTPVSNSTMGATATHTAGGQPLPPRKFVPPPGSARPVAAAMAPAPGGGYHHAHPPPVHSHPQQPRSAPRARAPSASSPPAGSPAAAAANAANTAQTNSAIHPTTGQVENTGRWTAEEHRLFLQGLEQHGKGWKKIATLIKSRTVVQIRTHAQKYFQKLAKARQNGEAVAVGGLAQVGGIGVPGQVVQSMPVQGMPVGTGENGEPLGISIPMGPDGQPVVTMRTTAIANSQVVHHHHHAGNMSIGSDPASLAAANGNVGIATANGTIVTTVQARGGRNRRKSNSGGTKRRAIGNVVRSAVREGRNVKRQKQTAEKRKGRANSVASAASGSTISSIPQAAPVVSQPPHPPHPTIVGANGKVEEYQVPNPLPSVSHVLDPYVATTTMGMPPPPVAGKGGVKNKGRGRQQLVQTSTHGTLPMAALEDAVFRLLTPATGAPTPSIQGGPPQPHPAPTSTNGIVDPLAPHAKIPIAHTQYHPSQQLPYQSSNLMYPQGIVSNHSPTGVADMSLLPSWVDAKNPPSWYNDGSDIDTLLEDAECLNWLSDTGDLEETYPPAMAEPTAVVSSASTMVVPTASLAPVELAPAMPVQDPTSVQVGGMVHLSTESLSFLVDEPSPHVAAMVAAPVGHHLPAFLEDPAAILSGGLSDSAIPYSSATEAVEASHHGDYAPPISELKLAGMGESDTNLMGFPDLDMGDEQAFVSALLENSGQSTMSFPKLGSDMHLMGNMSGVGLSGVQSGVALKEEPLDETA